MKSFFFFGTFIHLYCITQLLEFNDISCNIVFRKFLNEHQKSLKFDYVVFAVFSHVKFLYWYCFT